MAHFIKPDGSIFVDTAFLNSLDIPGVSLDSMGFGEFYFRTPKGRVEVDRMRGVDFPGQSGRSHKMYDDKGGRDAAEWLIEQAEKHNFSERVAAMDKMGSEDESIRNGLIRLAYSNPEMRSVLLPLLKSK
jgi:hypothetical protein